MAYYERHNAEAGECDSRTWSAECLRIEYTDSGTKYLCDVCGKIAFLDHEVHHEVFPHVSGDADKLY
ncbi:MAG TPA: hypothetical protein VIH45_02705 [Desulfuromonadaceae bacterium]